MDSKKNAIFSILKNNPSVSFTVRDLFVLYSKMYTCKISVVHLRRILRCLFNENKIFRSKTQLCGGFIYSFDLSVIEKEYTKYLLPYDFKNYFLLIQKITKTDFVKLSSNNKIRFPLNNKFILRYGEKYFEKSFVQEFITRLVAFIMGDGHIRKNKHELQFYFKEKLDAYKFQNDFKQVFFHEFINVRKGDFCYYCSICSVNLINLLIFLGAPVGNKIIQEVKVPKWLLYASNNLKKEFLSTIIGNEGSKPQNGRWRIQFVLSKEKQYVDSLLDFLNNIRELLYQFNITTTHIQLRTQPKRHFCGRFYFKGKENIHKFYNEFAFLYATEKQEVLESLIKRDSLK